MILRHATPVDNVDSIDELGLLVRMSQTAPRLIWLHSPRLTPSIILHVALRHRVEAAQVRVLTVSVRRGELRRWRRGLWYCDVDIAPDRIAGSQAWWDKRFDPDRLDLRLADALEEALAARLPS